MQKRNRPVGNYIIGLMAFSLLALPFVLSAQEGKRGRGGNGGIRKPRIENTVKANLYADNWFKLYINGKLDAPRVQHTPIPGNWFAPDFDDRAWDFATEHREEAVGPKQPYFEHDFEGAKWIWTKDLALDNTVLFRFRVEAPPNGSAVQDWPRGDFGDPNQVSAAAATKSIVRIAGRHTFGDGSPVPETAKAFEPLLDEVTVSWDETYVYVRSDSIPNHRMMFGIKAWNQQVPIPHDLEFKLPIKPKLLDKPAPTTLLGPLAIAINGIPIFDPTTQGGKHDAYEHGELDEFGGHAGRADDYHYHIAPFHLVEQAGKGNPIAYGLDGIPVYADVHGELDEAHGHFHDDGSYHYHGTTEKPYYMSGFRGEVDLDARPRTHGIREYTRPLRGATITGFEGTLENGYQLTYELAGENHRIDYQVKEDGADFTFVSPDGRERKESYQRRQRGGGGARPEGERERTPWIAAHKEEIDANKDGTISLTEMMNEARQTFAGYDADKNGQITRVESRERRARTAMGGFVREHFRELDENQDGMIATTELAALARKMFTKADRNGDEKIMGAEFERGAGGGGERRRGGDRKRPPPRSSDVPPVSNGSQSIPVLSKPSNNPLEAGGTTRKPPNFVVVLIDDMGWKDTGFSGNTFIETPHVDRLAREGVIFSQAYASAPNCAPTRACLISGQVSPRHGVYTVVDERHAPGRSHHKIFAAESRAEMPTEVVSMAEALKAGGYATGCFGMWNLGRGHDTPASPEGQGFDVFVRPQDLGFERNTYFHKQGTYLPDKLTEEALRFVHAERERPFFMYFSPHSVHAPFDPKPDLLKKYEAKAGAADHDPVYAATIEALDVNVGRIRTFLERLDLAKNTTIIFTSDNGANPEYTAPLKGGKGQLYEGGLRVPACAWGVGVTAKGSTCDEPIASIDIYPTLLDLAGLAVPANHQLDGISLVPVLSGAGSIHRDALYWHFPCYVGRSSPCSAMRSGDYKLIEFFEDPRVELYDLATDPNERKDLAPSAPDVAAKLHRQLQAWQRETGAALPRGPNPAFDPEAVPEKGQRGKKKKRVSMHTSSYMMSIGRRTA